ncbi:MAG: hypothetical protein ACKVP4_00530 [Hyphomicrobium sp.]
MTIETTASCRVYAILARDGRSGLVFRRGPTRAVLTLRWRLDDDTLEPGQWLRGRIYERRCDLSPNGELLVYMAAKWETPLESWTAVSRAPYLTALAMWKGHGAWGGGGVFNGPKDLGVNLGTLEPIAPKGQRIPWHPLDAEQRRASTPGGFTVARVADWAGRGEDDPICFHRMQRDGWRVVQRGEAGRYGADKNFAWVLELPEIVERFSPVTDAGQLPLVLRRELKAIGQRDGPWYVEDFVVQRQDGVALRLLANCSWADWQSNGDLLFALGGRLHRLTRAHAGDTAADPLENAKLVADLAPLTFRPIASPEWARAWPA